MPISARSRAALRARSTSTPNSSSSDSAHLRVRGPLVRDPAGVRRAPREVPAVWRGALRRAPAHATPAMPRSSPTRKQAKKMLESRKRSSASLRGFRAKRVCGPRHRDIRPTRKQVPPRMLMNPGWLLHLCCGDVTVAFGLARERQPGPLASRNGWPSRASTTALPFARQRRTADSPAMAATPEATSASRNWRGAGRSWTACVRPAS
jgi:hypothetical protein